MKKYMNIFLIFLFVHHHIYAGKLLAKQNEISNNEEKLDYKKMILDEYGGDEKKAQKYLAILEIFDRDADGLISADEFFALARAIDTLSAQPDKKHLIPAWLDAEARQTLRKAHKSYAARRRRMEEFGRMDTNGDGEVDIGEYRAYYNNATPPNAARDEDQLNAVFSEFDQNGDGFVGIEELFG